MSKVKTWTNFIFSAKPHEEIAVVPMETDEKDGLVCNIGQFLENASHHLHIECQGSVSKVSLGQDDADADLEIFLNRLGLFDQTSLPQLTKCEGHFSLLTKDIRTKFIIKHKCLMPGHIGSKTLKKKDGAIISLSKSEQFLSIERLVPFGSFACTPCIIEANKKCKEKAEAEATMEEDNPESSQSLTQHSISSGSEFVPSQSQLQSQSQSEDPEKKIIEAANFVLEQKGMKERFKTKLSTTMKASGTRTQKNTAKLVGAFMAAGCKLATSKEEDAINIYRYVTDNEVVQKKFLKTTLKPSAKLRAVMRSWRASKTRAERIVALSFALDEPCNSYSFLANFNKPSLSGPSKIKTSSPDSGEGDATLSDYDVVMESSDGQSSDEEDAEKEKSTQQDKEEKDFWDPFLGPKIFYEALHHFIEIGCRALTTPIFTPRYRQRMDPIMIKTIYDFFNSDQMIQETAFGTIRGRNSDGELMVKIF